MQKAELILTMLNQKSKKDVTFRFKRLYRNLFNPTFYLRAYANIYHKEGNMTPGIDNQTLDGFSTEKIKKLIEELRQERYYPKPVRRTYIPKKDGKMRPLGIPSVNDKLVQEAIRQILEAIYEPLFSNNSHGFRPNRSCQTALFQIKKKCIGCSWAVEGDIQGFFDNIDHDTLLTLMKRKIDDGRFIELIRRFLKAGYMEEGKKRNTITGTPQGGIISPILANIYLNELDWYMQTRIKKYIQGKRRTANKEYVNLNKRRHRLRQKGKYEEAKQILQKMKTLPSKNNMDINFRRIHYVRYADDFLVMVCGNKELAEHIRGEIADFLKTELQLELSMKKTLITNLLKSKVRFLGYEITKAKNDTYVCKGSTGVKKRSLNGQIMLLVPPDAIKAKIKPFTKNGRPIHYGHRVNLPLFEMITEYNAEIRGLYNYYSFATNVSKWMHRFKYFHYYSLIKTIARKEKTTAKKVIQKYGVDVKRKNGTGTRKVIGVKYHTKEREKILTYFNESLRRKDKPCTYDINPDVQGYPIHCELIRRLSASKCELCGKEGTPSDFEVHHIRKLKDLKKKYGKHGKEPPNWVKIMAKMNRKTLVLCKECHNKLHRGII